MRANDNLLIVFADNKIMINKMFLALQTKIFQPNVLRDK